MTDPQIQTEKAMIEINKSSSLSVDETYTDASEDKPAAAQILGVAILEFGVVFHSVRCLDFPWFDMSAEDYFHCLSSLSA